MKVKQPSILLALLLMAGFNLLASDPVGFTYDQSGNRIHKRTIVMNTQANFSSMAGFSKDTVMDQVAEAKLVIYPNPAIQEVNVRMFGVIWRNPEEQKWSISVYGLGGQLLITKEVYGPIGKLIISALQSGMYFLKIQHAGMTTTWPLIKK